MNEFTLQEEQTTDSAQRRINGRFTDEAFGQVAALFSGLSRSRPISQPQETNSYERQEQPSLGSWEESVGQAETHENGQDDHTQETLPTNGSSDREDENESEASRYFKLRGEELAPRTPDFKGTTKKEQQQRFILLFVWAHNNLVNQALSKEQVIEAAKKRKVYDQNFYRYFSDSASEYFWDTDDELELNPDGEQRVRNIVQEIDDSSVENGFAYWKAVSKPKGSRSTLGKGDKEEVNKWVDLDIDIGRIDVRTLNTPTNCAMFAIWCLTKRLGVAKAVKPNTALLYVKNKYTTISVDQKSFTTALGRPNNGNRFHKNGEGLYAVSKNLDLHEIMKG